jgi:hypothetical protein
MVYSSRCSHCQRVLPIWEQAALTYANNSDIIFASADVISHRSAVHKILHPPGYPTFVRVVQGKSTEISAGRTYEHFCAEAELIRKHSLLTTCQFYAPLRIIDRPAVVLATPQTERHSCRLLEQVCARAKVPFSRCFLDKESPQRYNLTFVYTDVNLTIGNVSRSDLPKCVSDFIRDPFGDWDISEAHRSTRRILILVFGYVWQIVHVKGVAKMFVRDFVMGRLSLDDFATRFGTKKHSIEDTPLYIVSNADRSRYLIWSNLKDIPALKDNLTRALSGDFDSEMMFSFRVISGFSRIWVWVTAASVVFLLLGGSILKYRWRTEKVE